MMFEKFATNSPIAERITQCAEESAAHFLYILYGYHAPYWLTTLLALIEGTKQFVASLVAQNIILEYRWQRGVRPDRRV